MGKRVTLWGGVALLTAALMCSTVAANMTGDGTGDSSDFAPVPIPENFRITVQTNKNVYQNRDVLRLTIQLLNNSADPAHVGLCPVTAVPEEPPVMVDAIEEVAQGFLDDVDVDVAVMPRPRVPIGYATLRRLGPSPVPQPVPGTDQADDAEEEAQLRPKRFVLPLFGSPQVPGHSTRIISTANILLAGPLLEPVPDEPDPQEQPQADGIANAQPDQPVEVIPAVGRHIPLRPGYYLLDCRVLRICGVRPAQAQKIIQIKRRLLRPSPPVVQPVPVPEPDPTADSQKKPTPRPNGREK